MLRCDPCPDRPDGSGFALSCKPVEIIELLFGQRRLGNRRAEQPEQSFSQRALGEDERNCRASVPDAIFRGGVSQKRPTTLESAVTHSPLQKTSA
jgi:hypothetical protein